ncbi:MAG: two pore domain potassium channel family protein [Gammaproteobacteria bacterium]|nr:two pore domain potassium channel family protein [Gammaproteobacteria bacterium]
MDFTFSYFEHFFSHLTMVWPLLATIALLIVVLGIGVGFLESWSRFDSIYWAFITATTVGYGDIRPIKPVSRILSILIALIGLTFTGIIVALAIDAATRSFDNARTSVNAASVIEKVGGASAVDRNSDLFTHAVNRA